MNKTEKKGRRIKFHFRWERITPTIQNPIEKNTETRETIAEGTMIRDIETRKGDNVNAD